MIGDDDDSSSEWSAFAEGDVARDCQVIQLQDVGNTFEPFQEIFHLKKVLNGGYVNLKGGF